MNEIHRILGIADKLKAAVAKNVRPFGVEEHRFVLEPVLTEPQVAKFEARWRIELPPDYRAFITGVGNGGAGPAYGLFPLEKTLTYQRTRVPDDFLLSPFPYLTSYNPYEDPKLSEYWQRAERGQVSNEEYEARQLKETTGSLALCHEGCGYLHLLIVSGPARGQMWLDATASDGGYVPLEVGFLEWYERWLDSALAGGDGIWWMSD
jgi:hypothetical protein